MRCERSLSIKLTDPLLRRFQNLLAEVPRAAGVFFVFVAAQDTDLPFETRFQAQTGEELDLLAITQQFDKPFDNIPHGWKVILALRSPKGANSILATVPAVEDWYDRPFAEALRLTIIQIV